MAILSISLAVCQVDGFVARSFCWTGSDVGVCSPTSRGHDRLQRPSIVFKKATEKGDNPDVDEDETARPKQKKVKLDGMERAWRYAKKPLLSIGAKGATLSHGNSLRQLLEQHTAVKVKVNTRRFEGSLEKAFEELRGLAEENGAPAGIEMLQTREKDKIILFGWPGTTQRIQDNQFPVQEESS